MTKDNCNNPTIELWVSPDLIILETECHTATATYLPWSDATGTRTYWRLTTAVYAWLVRKMRGARHAYDEGKLDPATWEDLQKRFSYVKSLAEANLEVAPRLAPDLVQAALADVVKDLPKKAEAEQERLAVAFLCGCNRAHPNERVGLIVERDGGRMEWLGLSAPAYLAALETVT